MKDRKYIFIIIGLLCAAALAFTFPKTYARKAFLRNRERSRQRSGSLLPAMKDTVEDHLR